MSVFDAITAMPELPKHISPGDLACWLPGDGAEPTVFEVIELRPPEAPQSILYTDPLLEEHQKSNPFNWTKLTRVYVEEGRIRSLSAEGEVVVLWREGNHE